MSALENCRSYILEGPTTDVRKPQSGSDRREPAKDIDPSDKKGEMSNARAVNSARAAGW